MDYGLFTLYFNTEQLQKEMNELQKRKINFGLAYIKRFSVQPNVSWNNLPHKKNIWDFTVLRRKKKYIYFW